MSSIIVAGDTSGTVTLAAPAVAGTTTLTLPTTSGTVLTTANTFGAGTGPAFSAYQSSPTTLINGVFTKVLFQTEEFYTNNNFASSTFTPTVAGYYQINALTGTSQSAGTLITEIFKNGASYKRGSTNQLATGVGIMSLVSSIVYCNGSTDYIEIYAYQSQGSSVTTLANIQYTWFNGSMIRSA